MPNYKHESLKKEFSMYFKRSKGTPTKIAWDFAKERGIDHKATDLLPSMKTLYDWAHEMAKK